MCAKTWPRPCSKPPVTRPLYPAASRTSTRMALRPTSPSPRWAVRRGDVASALAAWREIKQAANEAVIKHGGTITHHHAVGRDHRPGYEQETPPLYRQMLQAAKATVDPQASSTRAC